jgi:UDP-N-acetylmuramoylalanine--D-glutamate ligase
VGAAVLAKQLGYNVFVSDMEAIDELYLRELQQYNIDFEQGGHTSEKILAAQQIIKSPGISTQKSDILRTAQAQGIEILSEIEFAARHTPAKIIGITGTNGKTTTTTLIHHILKKADYNVGLAGNVGISLARQVALHKHDWYVVELSSFQLDDMHQSHINIAILCNITPDHLDRYNNNLHEYQASKLRILQNQTAADAFIYNPTDPLTATALQRHTQPIAAQHHTFSLDIDTQKGAFLHQNQLIVRTEGTDFRFDTQQLSKNLQGKHNAYNAMCAVIAARIAGVNHDTIAEALTDYKGEEHRQEHVATIDGTDYINDMSTNVDSTYYALDAQTKPIIWIAGGEEPNPSNDYTPIQRLVRENVKAIVYLGKDNTRIHAAFAPLQKPTAHTTTMTDAVAAAKAFATAGDVVLLSPACKSFDLFKSYKDRGKQFKAAVNAL